MGINRNAMEQDAKQEQGTRDPEPGEFVPQSGKTYIVRILPRDIDEQESAAGARDFGWGYRTHYSYTRMDGTTARDISCPKSYGMDQPCRICEEGEKLYKSPNEEDKKLAKDFWRKLKVLVNVLDLTDQESVKKGIQWWRIPRGFNQPYDKIREYVLNANWDTNGKDILDLVVGKNFELKVVGKKESASGYLENNLTPLPQPYDVMPYLQLTPDWRARINSLKTHMPKKLSREDMDAILGPVAGSHPAPASPAPLPGNAAPVAASCPAAAPAGLPPLPSGPAIAQSAAPAPSAAPAVLANKPECFGNEFKPRSDKCKACTGFRDACRTEYLEK
jgi:hypothetical protein